ncbi:hypothetical protein GIB67_035207 [Kingdonia uniflora]|uniref:GRF1-interacting factor 3 n=1 Tax=Kingdonia uniflora TaxID=39325 RepID=A0A7J7KXQ2_9MAGN|nr:hypothetical protein GIB67_035207 [Kingdonia uniflora]
MNLLGSRWKQIDLTYQAVLQKNLMYLAAIADAQPPAPSLSTQMPTPLGMQQGVPYMQHSQASMAQQPQQSGGFPPKVPMQFNPQHIQQQDQQHHQIHMGMRPGVSNGMSSEVSLGGNGGVPPSSTISMSDFSRGVGVGTSNSMEARGKDQDGMERGSGDGQGNSVAGHNVANGEH